MRPCSRRELLAAALAGTAVLAAAPGAAAVAGEMPPAATDPFRTLTDPKVLSETEMKHVPLIQVPEPVRAGRAADVWIRVGRVLHPMEPAHHIEWIELLVQGLPLARVDLSAGPAQAVAGFRLVLAAPAVVEARTFCNLHGYWKAVQQIPVT